jgi:hypothetical protein
VTSATILLIAEGLAAVGHVGDTRAYLLRNGRVYRLTRDHTVGQRLADSGQRTPEEIAVLPTAQTVYQALGHETPLHTDVSYFEASPKDRFALVTAAVHRRIADSEVQDLNERCDAAADLARAVVQLGFRRDPNDDLTCVAAEVLRGIAPGSAEDPLRAFRHVKLFEGMRDDQMMRLLAVLQPMHVEAGQTLFEQGDASEFLYVITMGRVDVIRDGRHLASLGPGNVVGELALLIGDRRSATIRVTSAAQLLALRREELFELVQSDPNLGVHLYHNLSLTLAKRLRDASGRHA